MKLHNDGPASQNIHAGERIAQAMLLPVTQVAFEVVKGLSATTRGASGLGLLRTQ